MLTKFLPLLALLILCFSFNSWAQSQAELNDQVYREFQQVDNKLNKVYRQILVKYKEDTLFIRNLKTSERLWIQLRDAEMDAKYPRGEDLGSSYTLCYYSFLIRLTNERIKFLLEWLPKGPFEGDVCAGSVKFSE